MRWETSIPRMTYNQCQPDYCTHCKYFCQSETSLFAEPSNFHFGLIQQCDSGFNLAFLDSLQEGHNIFSKLSSEEYKQALGNIKHCILATDLALFFPNKARLFDLVQREAFSWTVPDHRCVIKLNNEFNRF